MEYLPGVLVFLMLLSVFAIKGRLCISVSHLCRPCVAQRTNQLKLDVGPVHKSLLLRHLGSCIKELREHWAQCTVQRQHYCCCVFICLSLGTQVVVDLLSTGYGVHSPPVLIPRNPPS